MTVLTRAAPRSASIPPRCRATSSSAATGGRARPASASTWSTPRPARPSPASPTPAIEDAHGRRRRGPCRRPRPGRPPPPRKRSEILRRCFELMLERRRCWPSSSRSRTARRSPTPRARSPTAAEFFRWFSEEAVRLNGELTVAPSGANRILVEHQPIGVAVLVTPVELPRRHGRPARSPRRSPPAAPCVLKPATETPLHRLRAGRALRRGRRARRRRQRAHHLALRRHGQRHAARSARAQALLHRLDRGRPHAAARRRPTRCSTARWNSAATPRSSSSTTPTSMRRSTAR